MQYDVWSRGIFFFIYRVGSVELQEQINLESYQNMRDYYTQYEAFFGTVHSTPNSPYSVSELLMKLEHNVQENKKKNVEVLQLASEVRPQA